MHIMLRGHVCDTLSHGETTGSEPMFMSDIILNNMTHGRAQEAAEVYIVYHRFSAISGT